MVSEKIIYSILVVIILAGGASVGLLAGNAIGHTSSSSSTTQNIYSLTMVVQTDVQFNASVGGQPAFYVLQNGTLESSAMIYFPANTLIDLTIIDYDTGPAPLENNSYANVSGTVGGFEYVFNSTDPAGLNQSQVVTTYFQKATSINASNVAHTFTIPQLNLNLPLQPISTTITQFYLNQTGSYTWQCFAECGTGPLGQGASMETAGWMTGTVVVY